MIPVHISVDGIQKQRKLNVEVLDLPSLTPQAMLVCFYESLLQTNDKHGGHQLSPDGQHRSRWLSRTLRSTSGRRPAIAHARAQMAAALLAGESFPGSTRTAPAKARCAPSI